MTTQAPRPHLPIGELLWAPVVHGVQLVPGGGDGTLIAAILCANPGTRGILFDTAEGLAQAPARLDEAGVADRCALSTGDFFRGVATGADYYLLKSVVHDWDDERAGVVLSHIRAAIPDRGRLLIIEPVLAEITTADGSPGLYLSDLNMLVNVGGRERTLEEFRHLCADSGFTLTRTVPLPPSTGFSIIEARPS